MLKRTMLWCCLPCLLAVQAGCQRPGTDAVSADKSAQEAAAIASESLVDRSAGEHAVPETSPDEPAPLTTVAATFSPLFPDRTELFEPPKRATGSVRRDDEHGESVELKGFITVDKPRAVLSIDGVISPIAEGGEKYGVQVISIQPPSVVLQRGRNRWTATLE